MKYLIFSKDKKGLTILLRYGLIELLITNANPSRAWVEMFFNYHLIILISSK